MGNVWASNKTIRDFHEFELWHKLLQYGLSPSGEWAMWRIQAAEKTDTLFVRHIASGKEYKYKNTSAPEFSKDSHWIVFSEPAGENAAAGIAYQVKLVCLAELVPAGIDRLLDKRGGRRPRCSGLCLGDREAA